MFVYRILETIRAIFGNPRRESFVRFAEPERIDEEIELPKLTPEISDAIKIVAGTQVQSISPTFKLVFFSILILTIASGIGAILIAFLGETPATPNQQTVFDTLNTAWKMGFGAIIGLVGGKTT